MNSAEVEKNLSTHALRLGVSEAKLRAIYARGVKDCVQNGYTESPTIYGLARVQRFVLAFATKNPRLSPDAEFLPKNCNLSDDCTPLSITENELRSLPLILEATSGNTEYLNRLFPNDIIHSTVFDTDTRDLTICGDNWSCVFNTATGKTDIYTVE